MKHVRTEFIPYVSLSFTNKEIEVMSYCARHHYDLKCNNLVGKDGALFKMERLQNACGPTVTHRLGFSDLDTINKALEIGSMVVHLPSLKNEVADTSSRLKAAFYQLFNYLREVTPEPITLID